jgi:DNA-binding NtrC family response regulator
MGSRILVVDQEEKFLQTLANRLESSGFPVETLPDASEALHVIEGTDLDVLIFGEPDDGANFLGLLWEIKRLRPHVAIIMLTARVSSDFAIQAMKLGIYDCLPKPTNITELIERINDAVSGGTK